MAFMSAIRLLVLGCAGSTLLLAATAARAGALYKCDAADGSTAYTSTRQGYTNCTTLSVFADPPKADAPAAAPSPGAPAKGWVYEENPREPVLAAATRSHVPPS